jgi:hypothetical protein
MNIPTTPVVHVDDGKMSKAERHRLGSPIAEVTDGRSEAEQLDDKLTAALKHYGYEIHPKAQETPSLTMEEYLALRGLIEKNGLLQPLLMYKDMLVDGRHRLMACYDLGMPTKSRQLHDAADLEAVIYDAEARRHQTKSQMVAFTVLYYEDRVRELTEAAAERQKKGTPSDPEGQEVVSPSTFIADTSGSGIRLANRATALLNAGRVDLLIDVRDSVLPSIEAAYQQHLDEQKGSEDKPEQYEMLVDNLTKIGNALKAASTNVAEIRDRLAWIDDDGSIEAFCLLVEKVTTALENDHAEIISQLSVKEADDA